MRAVAAVITTMRAKGMSDRDILDVVEAMASVQEQPQDGIERQREMGAARVARYRARRSLRESEWTAIRDRIMARDGTLCGYCGDTAGPFAVDHIVPLAQGGSNDDENLIVACRRCNSAKAGMTVEQWRGRR